MAISNYEDVEKLIAACKGYGVAMIRGEVSEGQIFNIVEVMACNDDMDAFDKMNNMDEGDGETIVFFTSETWDDDCGNDHDFLGFRKLTNATAHIFN